MKEREIRSEFRTNKTLMRKEEEKIETFQFDFNHYTELQSAEAGGFKTSPISLILYSTYITEIDCSHW